MNAVKIALVCAFAFQLSGCFTRYVSAPEMWPVPPKIERPAIPGGAEDLSEREQILMRYALELEAAYNSVRENTIQHNVDAGLMEPEEVE